MTNDKIQRSIAPKFCFSALLLSLFLAAAIPTIYADDKGVEIIDATAMGTSTQMGQIVNIKVTIYQYSTPADRQVLVNAFKKGQSPGLVKALDKMKTVGRIAITGTVGYDLTYIALIPSPTGRTIRFAANRPIGIGEAYHNTPSTAYDLLAGEFVLSDTDKNKNAGTLYPASQLIINKEGQLQFELRQNPWKLSNILDWNNAGSKAKPK